MTTTIYDNLSEFDLLQLIDLDTKAGLEGSLTYTVENWTWIFDEPALAEASEDDDVDLLREALAVTRSRREKWWAAHPHPTQIPVLDAHEAEVRRREREAAR